LRVTTGCKLAIDGVSLQNKLATTGLDDKLVYDLPKSKQSKPIYYDLLQSFIIQTGGIHHFLHGYPSSLFSPFATARDHWFRFKISQQSFTDHFTTHKVQDHGQSQPELELKNVLSTTKT
jgi:hypothetical protein